VWAPLGFLAAVMIVFWSSFSVLVNVYAAVFIGLPIFGWYYARRKGWGSPTPLAILGIVFAAAWVYISFRSGWVMRSVTPVDPSAHGFWSFPVYDVALSADVIFYCVGLWWLSNKEGRQHVQATAWLIFMLLALYPVEYWTKAVGPQPSEPLAFGYGTAIAVGIGLVAYYWGVMSGFLTDELKQILDANEAQEQSGTALPEPV
jgi:hypothetical protein